MRDSTIALSAEPTAGGVTACGIQSRAPFGARVINQNKEKDMSWFKRDGPIEYPKFDIKVEYPSGAVTETVDEAHIREQGAAARFLAAKKRRDGYQVEIEFSGISREDPIGKYTLKLS
ncbi:hypothetical protein DZC73_07640 [Albitalea terrae]|uniref:Uncharacterized protein n=1 Tax=Piscinibacter terrae TaxID=2496871 RepID=A0A3N7J1C4_9BURK|nr:hypothetical protein DZC73_07640 [Albitalea terrae]